MAGPGVLSAVAGLGLVAGACVLGQARSCAADGSGDDPDALAASVRGSAFVGEARTADAATFLYEPAGTSMGEEAIVVLCLGETAISAGPVYQPILSDDRAATAVRVGGSSTGIDGVETHHPGHVVAHVNDDAIVELEVEWTNATGTSDRRSWSAAVSMGLHLVPLPPGVPPDALVYYRFLDATGETVSAHPGQ